MADILVVDDDKMICEALAAVGRHLGHHVTCALSLGQGLREAGSGKFDVIFLDVRLPDGDGLKALSRISEKPSSPEVIVITGEGGPDSADMAIRNGAWDYVEKPLSMETVSLFLARALRYREGKQTKRLATLLKRDGIIGNSAQIKACLDLVARAANTDSNVLITGETGTGKELFARAIRENSARTSRNFVVVDCAALPENLVESVLFGHKKGAFTGADRDRDGLIRQADTGTLFLDEVGELPLSIQRTFLRVLQERSFRPVGGKTELTSDFRVVAATNGDLDKLVAQGRFRRDLLFRLRS
ncbi:MAG: sigma-54-dependent Fis family transcriptional regulator, partial [Deltaproteobacteria bacterium]|nr:sigma-54-dependent Fis family transcriptional regulator [Deltaproteobacteria bacterium]